MAMYDDRIDSAYALTSLSPQVNWTAIIAAGLCLLMLIVPAKARGASDNIEEVVDEIVVIGSRTPVRSALDSMRPVDLLSAADIKQAIGEQDSGKILRALLPSFNLIDSTISDGSDSVRPAALRGLGPDQTLVLINGKRRHPSALVHVNGSYGRGTAGTDFAAIPAVSIGSVQVLRDGAAAQYGSDAIAGVVNINLADFDAGEGNSSLQIGQTYTGDGQQLRLNGALGFGYSSAKGTITIDLSERQRTNRNGADGTCQYSAACDDPREATFNRGSFRIGDAENINFGITTNLAVKLRNDITPYFFALLSRRGSVSGGFYRTASNSGNNPEIYPNGFLPLINTEIFDFSFVTGVKADDLLGFDTDLSISHGINSFDFGVDNSLNATYAGTDAPTTADSGGFGLSQTVLSLDFTRELLLPILERTGLFTFGGEWRQENYEINAGEPYSYLDYCADDLATPAGRCRDAPGNQVPGIQVFRGFSPNNEIDETRDIGAVYADGEISIIDDLNLGLAMRYEYYDDAGSSFAINGRARYDFSSLIALRSSIGTGFRAPSLSQTWFNSSSTQFVGDQRLEVGTFNASHPIARALNIPELKPEDSVHYATGLVLRPFPSLSLTLDLYQINVKDRIILGGQVSANPEDMHFTQSAIISLFQDNNVDAAQFFINLAETRTRGLDAIVQWQLPKIYGFDPDFTLTLSYAETKIKGGISTPGRLAEEPGLADILLSPTERARIESYVPNFRLSLTHVWQSPLWRLALGLRHYGSYRITESETSQKFSPETLFDIEISRQFATIFSVALGVRNIFDTTPDRTQVSRSRSCAAENVLDGTDDACYVQSDGVFLYNRRSAPFGFNGAFYYLRLTAQF